MNTLRFKARVIAALFLLAAGLHESAPLTAVAALPPPAAIAVPTALTAAPPAAPTPAFGADLGLPTGFALASTASACGSGFVTQAEVLKCPAAIQNHQLVFVWNFDQNSCTSKPCAPPDGFNLIRAINKGAGPASTFAQATGSDHGVILQVTGADVIGSCFYVLPYRGTNDYGRKSPPVCVDEVDHFALDAKRVGSAHSYSHDDGTSCKSPDSNPAGYGIMMSESGSTLTAGYVTRSGGTSVLGVLANPVDTLAQAIAVGEAVSNAGNNTCNHYRDIYQGLMYFDLSSIAAKAAGKTVTKATLALDVTKGAYNSGSSSGGDGSEHAGAPNCAVTIGFPTNVNVGSDFSFPNRIMFDRFATMNGGVGNVNVDITGMMRAWLHPGGVNRGIVISPSYMDPTKAPAAGNTVLYNADCMSRYGTPKLTVDLQ